ncbi:MAG: hypothetical protein KA059_09290 [Elusimicrobiales bacterium]|nr:hypothetical protein [Elusimicrobiales bacterium]
MEDKITLTKAVIASDTGDLMLDTGSFEYSNIKGNDRLYNVGGGVNVGGNSSKAGDGPVKNKVTYNVSGNYGFSDSRQTNFATIGEGTITVRDTSASLGAGGSSIGNTDEYSGLKRDVSKAQYSTMDLGVQLSVDKSTINAIMHPIETYQDTVEGLTQIEDRGRKIEEQTYVAEKTGNLIEYKHFTTDDKVQYCLNMDDYEEKKANGGEITALDTLVYVKSKSAAGYELDRSDVSDLRLASRYVIDDATNGILENLKANIRVNSREDVNASLAVLDRFDSEDAAAARAYLAGVREADKQTSVIGTDTGIPSVASNDGLVYGGSTEKSGGVREMLEGWGQVLNSWGTEKNQEITNSSVVKSAHEYGEYLNNNPDVALATCFGAAAIGTGVPILATTSETWLPTVITAVESDRTKDAVFGAVTNTASYIATTDSNDRTASGYANAIITGCVTGAVISPMTGTSAYDLTMTSTSRFFLSGATGAIADATSQTISNNGDITKVNFTQSVYTGIATGLTTTLGGLQADNLVRPVYSEASGLANGTMIIPTVSGSILINGITNQDNKNGK